MPYPSFSMYCVHVDNRRVALPELKRLRRQFVKQAQEWAAVAQGSGDEPGAREKAIANGFLEYIYTNTC